MLDPLNLCDDPCDAWRSPVKLKRRNRLGFDDRPDRQRHYFIHNVIVFMCIVIVNCDLLSSRYSFSFQHLNNPWAAIVLRTLECSVIQDRLPVQYKYTPSFFIRIIFIRIKARFHENLRKF